MPSHTETWRDHTSYARRAHNHGRLLPMERPSGEPSLLAGTGILLLIAAAVWFAITAFAEPPANASGAAEQPASPVPAPSAFEASAAGQGEGGR